MNRRRVRSQGCGGRRQMRATAAALSSAALALAVVLAGCGSSTTSVTGNNQQGLTHGQPITIWHPDPTSLVPSNSNEEGGMEVLDALYTGLINYNRDTAEPENAMAESITADAASKVYTITIKPGWTFHDGTPVKAANFVNAWNYGANGNNAQANQSFYAPIAGFSQVAGEFDSKGKLVKKPEKQTLSGLQVLDDHSFTVELSQPLVNFTARLGVLAFMPQPDSFFADPKAAAEHPVGNGPFQFVSWDKGKTLDIKRFDGYQGPDKAGVDALRFTMYTDAGAAYTDLVDGKLDIMEGLPTAALLGGKYQRELDGRFEQRNSLSLTTLAFPQFVPAFTNPNLAKAISLAIDRKALNDTLMAGTRPPADGWVPPGVRGYVPGQCGDLCQFDVQRAQQYLAQAGGFTGTLQLGYPKDAGQGELVEGICNSIKENLKLNCEPTPSPDLVSFLVDARKPTGKAAMVRMTYQADYPSIDNFMLELYYSKGGANMDFYTSKPFDELVDKAMAAPNQGQFLADMQTAQRQLQTDMPAVPLYTVRDVVGYSERIAQLPMTKIGNIDWSGVRLN